LFGLSGLVLGFVLGIVWVLWVLCVGLLLFCVLFLCSFCGDHPCVGGASFTDLSTDGLLVFQSSFICTCVRACVRAGVRVCIYVSV